MKKSWNNFLTALEFLTRIKFSRRSQWEEGSFGRSVVFFPVIGCIIGLGMQAALLLCTWLQIPLLLQAVLLMSFELMLTGSLLYDGFMDTCDGVFSARSRSRMLEIMKDSHVGANAVLGVVLLLLLKVSLFTAFSTEHLFRLLLALYIVSRTMMVLFIVHFPNARPGGLGALFQAGTSQATSIAAFITGAILLGLVNPGLFIPAGLTVLLGAATAWYLTGQLGGLTGDTLGFLTETGEVYFLLAVFVWIKLGQFC